MAHRPVTKEYWLTLLEFWVCFFLGLFGVHKLIQKKYKMFFLYLFTLGLFGIGWLVDLVRIMIRAFKIYYGKGDVSLHQNRRQLSLAADAPLPVVGSDGIMLKAGEVCHYRGSAYGYKSKERVVGYAGGHHGVSVRVAKGVSYRVGQSKSQAVRATIEERYPGVLYVTSNRVVFSSTQGAFDKAISSLSSMTLGDDGIVFQFGDKIIPVLIVDALYVHQIISRIYQNL